MAEIRPFNGVRYNSGNADISALVAPPYDVISEQYREELYERHGKNVVRIDFGKPLDADTDTENRYSRSAKYLKEWLAEGTLAREDAPALYLYEVDYITPSGEAKTMAGFIALLRLEDWDAGIVLPHEGTLKGPKADRFELLKTTGASPSQIFSLYSDTKKEVTGALLAATKGKDADAFARDEDGATHRLWAVKDKDVIETVQKAMKGKKIFIADGHHRYETALAFRDFCRENACHADSDRFDYVPMFLSNMEEDGLTILPTHRLVERSDIPLDAILERSGRYFGIEKAPFKNGHDEKKAFLKNLVAKGKTSNCFGFYYKGSPEIHLLTLKELDPVTEALRCKSSDTYCKLDVTILQTLVLERVLGIDTQAISERRSVQFEKDGEKAIDRVASGEFSMCFLLNATRVKEVREVALAGEIMPQKSTYFYPKLLTGFVIAELIRKF